MKIRLADKADAGQLVCLNIAFNASTVNAEHIAMSLANSSDHEKTVVGEVDGQLVGFACLQIYRSWCYPYPWAELTELYVVSEYQRRGIGRALVSFVEALAKDAGASDIVLLTSKQNIAAQSLYRSCGYLEQVKCAFHKELSRMEP